MGMAELDLGIKVITKMALLGLFSSILDIILKQSGREDITQFVYMGSALFAIGVVALYIYKVYNATITTFGF